MPRYSMNEQTTYRWSFDEDLLHIRDAGYDALGIWLRKVFDFGVERAIDLFQESGLSASSVSWIGGFTGADAATPRENLAVARDALQLAAEFRADCLVLYTGGRNGHTQRHCTRLVSEALDALLPIAEEHGVPIALEPMHPACAKDWTALTSLDQTLQLVRKHRSAALRISLDTYHFSLVDTADERLSELVPHLAVVHLGDYVEPRGVDLARVPLGAGQCPLQKTVARLRQYGYDGAYDVKLLGPEIEFCDYHDLLRQSREAASQLLASEPLAPVPSPNHLSQTAVTRATRPRHQRSAVDSSQRASFHFRS